MNNQFAFTRLKLSQTQYIKGYFYLSAITKEDDIESVDFRYFIDDGIDFIPTKNGFRVPYKLLNEFLNQLVKDITDEDYFCNTADGRSIYIRYLEDAKGEFIDIRVKVKSERYSGWTKQGVRFLISDYLNLQTEVITFIKNDLSIKNYENLFESKVITLEYKSKKKLKKSLADSSQINPDLLKIINS